MDIKNTRFSSIEQITGQYLQQGTTKKSSSDQTASFQDVFQKTVQATEDAAALKFSKHASQRLSDRNIQLSETQMDRLQKGAQLSTEKGIKESLVLMDDYAFIVNTQNNTVITAMEQNSEGGNVYTNIDGAVMV